MEVQMLDEAEFEIANRLYTEGIKNTTPGLTREARYKPLLDYYKEVTGMEETEPNAIMHHRIFQYGPPCENCGKPYRISKASFCAACGHKRESNK
jgi:rRNA maturation endonuclease Nob1